MAMRKSIFVAVVVVVLAAMTAMAVEVDEQKQQIPYRTGSTIDIPPSIEMEPPVIGGLPIYDTAEQPAVADNNEPLPPQTDADPIASESESDDTPRLSITRPEPTEKHEEVFNADVTTAKTANVETPAPVDDAATRPLTSLDDIQVNPATLPCCRAIFCIDHRSFEGDTAETVSRLIPQIGATIPRCLHAGDVSGIDVTLVPPSAPVDVLATLLTATKPDYIIAPTWETAERAAAAGLVSNAKIRLRNGCPECVARADFPMVDEDDEYIDTGRPALYTDATTAARIATWSLPVIVQKHWTEQAGTALVHVPATAALSAVWALPPAGAADTMPQIRSVTVVATAAAQVHADATPVEPPFVLARRSLEWLAVRCVDARCTPSTEAAVMYMTGVTDHIRTMARPSRPADPNPIVDHTAQMYIDGSKPVECRQESMPASNNGGSAETVATIDNVRTTSIAQKCGRAVTAVVRLCGRVAAAIASHVSRVWSAVCSATGALVAGIARARNGVPAGADGTKGIDPMRVSVKLGSSVLVLNVVDMLICGIILVLVVAVVAMVLAVKSRSASADGNRMPPVPLDPPKIRQVGEVGWQ